MAIWTNGDDTQLLLEAGIYVFDGLAGADRLNFGTERRSGYTITKAADGTVHVDSISGASSVLQLTLSNIETLLFNNWKDTVDLTTLFGSTPVTITDDTPGTAIGNVSYSLAFGTPVTGLAASDFTVSNGHVVSVAGVGANYTVVVAPNAGTVGNLGLTLNAAAAVDLGARPNAAASAAAQPIDTIAPLATGFVPGDEAGAVAVASDIVVTFSEAVQKGAGNIVLKTAAGATVATFEAAASPQLNLVGNTLTLNPGADLDHGTGYRLEFAAGTVKDLAGNAWAGTTSYNFMTEAGPSVVTGTSAADLLDGTGLADAISGLDGNDTLAGLGGDDSLNGGQGIDTALFSGNNAQFQRTLAPSGDWSVHALSGSEGTDLLTGIERLQFADRKIALDLGASGHAAQALEALGVLAPTQAGDPSAVGSVLGLIDQGADLHDVMHLALTADLAGLLPGAASNADLAAMAYQNLVGAPADPAMVDTLLSYMDGRNAHYSQADFLTALAGLDINQAHIGLAGLQQTGVEYL